MVWLYWSASLIAAAPSAPMLLSKRLCSVGESRMEHGRTEAGGAERRDTFPRTHCSVVSVLLLYLSASPIAAAPSSPMLLFQRLSVQWEYTEGQRMKVFDFKGCS